MRTSQLALAAGLAGTGLLSDRIGPVDALPLEEGNLGHCFAFAGTDFDPQGAGTKGNTKIGTYVTTSDTMATVETDGYFDNSLVYTTMNTGDLLVVNASDGIRIYELTVSGTDVALKGVMDDFFILNGAITDVSTAGQEYMVAPFAGTVFAVYSVIHGAIATADATLTVKTAAGTVGTITVANSGSAAGDVDSLTSGLSNTAVAAGATVEVETDGASTNAVKASLTVVCRRT
ncbi:MAG: hypothetical protein OXT06_18995 [Rhodospirillaceae bacterium]|nr:hypothetical protein [Rhodospirillaceae bacterium]